MPPPGNPPHRPKEPDWLGALVSELESLDIEDWFDCLSTLHPDVIDAYVYRLRKKRYKATEAVKTMIKSMSEPAPSKITKYIENELYARSSMITYY